MELKRLKKACDWYMTLNEEEQEHISILFEIFNLTDKLIKEIANANKNNGD